MHRVATSCVTVALALALLAGCNEAVSPPVEDGSDLTDGAADLSTDQRTDRPPDAPAEGEGGEDDADGSDALPEGTDTAPEGEEPAGETVEGTDAPPEGEEPGGETVEGRDGVDADGTEAADAAEGEGGEAVEDPAAEGDGEAVEDAAADDGGADEIEVSELCGNGDVDPGEECDDYRNGDPLDGCRDDCTFTCHEVTQAADCNDGRGCTDDVCSPVSHVCIHPVSLSSRACRLAAGDCDTVEYCDGTSIDCPADAFRASDYVCRAYADYCDTAERCTGSAAACPADAFKGTDVVCRPVTGPCDAEERCTGSAAACPADLYRGPADVCRPAADGCDAPETCTGGGAACPPDLFRPSGTPCDDESPCTWPDLCNGIGDCTSVPVAAMHDVERVSAGLDHTCALMRGGDVRCWGRNNAGQIGDGTTLTRYLPQDVSGLFPGASDVSAGNSFTCALLETGGVKCWGRNNQGQIGDGTATTRLLPVDVLGMAAGVRLVSAGNQHVCAVTTGGGVRCWGDNGAGQLGDNSTTDRRSPVATAGLSTGTSLVSAGGYHACALLSTGAVRCWGHNDYGQLGDGSVAGRRTPVAVAGLSGGVAAVSAGGWHSCALLSTGEVKCWGRNSSGQVGDNTTTSRRSPVSVWGLSAGAAAVSAGDAYTCALLSTGGVKCWGANSYGQLGDGTATGRYTPVTVAGIAAGATFLSAATNHTCAVTTAGAVMCWGYNNYGQLGDGTTVARRTPVSVGCP